MQHTKRYAVILSSGIGKRTGFDIPKQLVKIRGTELLLRSIAIFNNKNSMVNFDKIIITVPPSSTFGFDWKKFIADNISLNVNPELNLLQTDNKNYPAGSGHRIEPQRIDVFDKIAIIEGGDLRQKSVYNALNYIEKNFICCDAGDSAFDSDFNSNTNLYLNSNSNTDSRLDSNPCSCSDFVSYSDSDSAPYSSSNSIVFIHDSARPFVTNGEIYMLNKSASEFGASFLFGFVTDTIKSVECRERMEDYSIEENSGHEYPELKYFNTLDRNNLIAAKTPQVFRFNIIKKAMDKIFKKNNRLNNDEIPSSGKNAKNADTEQLAGHGAAEIIGAVNKTYGNGIETDLEKFTDDISFIENCGIPAKPILSNEFNIKITSASDVELAEFFLDKFDRINKKITDRQIINNM